MGRVFRAVFKRNLQQCQVAACNTTFHRCKPAAMLHVVVYTCFEDAFPNNCFSAGKNYIEIIAYMIDIFRLLRSN